MDALEEETKRAAMLGLLAAGRKAAPAPRKRAGRPRKWASEADRKWAYRHKTSVTGRNRHGKH